MSLRRAFQDAILVRNVVARATQAMEHATPEALKKYLHDHPDADPKNHTVKKPKSDSSKKDLADAEKTVGQADRNVARLRKVLNGRRVLPEDADPILSSLHEQYNKVKKQTEKQIDKAEKFLKDNPDHPKTKHIEWELKLLKENMGRRKDLATGSPEKARDLITHEGLGDGPLRKSPYHKIWDHAKNLEGGVSSYTSAMKSLQKFMSGEE